jgi:2-desacetyl-2-hydroxyethyl bacteriochlorophyllide A dehydrogenase
VLTDVMDALVWEGPRRIAVRQLPRPLAAPHEVLVRVGVVGICGSELEGFVGSMANRVPPLVMGHEFSGVVVSDDPTLAGQRVAVNPLLSCGTCQDCLDGRPNICASRGVIGIARPGGFAELVAVPRASLIPLPDQLDGVAGALVEPLANVVHAYALGTRVRVPRSVLILGAGSLGLLAVQVARAGGATLVVASDLNTDRLDTAGRVGASSVVRAGQPATEAELNDLAPHGYDVVIDCVGAAPTKAQALRSVRSGGTVVLLGLHDDASPLSSHEIIRREISLTGSYTYVAEDVARAVELLRTGVIDYSGWTEVRPLSEGPAAFDELVDRPGASAKILLTPGAASA